MGDSQRLFIGQLIKPQKHHLYLSSIYKNILAHFPAQSPAKKKKSHPEESFLYFRKWNFLALILKKILYFWKWNPALSGLNTQNFSLKKNFLYFFLKKPALKKFLIFSQKKALLIFSQKKAFLLFPQMKPCTFEPKL